MRRRVYLSAVLLLGVGRAGAQTPAAPWKTIVTAHFRVHYTAPAEVWTVGAARRLEAIRERLISEIGYAPPEVIDVLVADPFAQPNGMALPLLRAPRLVLLASPPGPGSGLGTYRDWPELVALHEEAHLVHLLRPSRSPFGHVIEQLLPLGPITRRAPRWVHEGYATYLEGKLTGSGRPNGDVRAAILRQRARAGRLPSYQQMASDSQTWMGMSMAYLAGSAYLEWLVERSGPESLKKLWTRMTARADRGFDAAFEGVFGDGPAKLYERFCAELTWRAMEVEQRMKPVVAEGELWQELTWTTGEPALSADGKQLAVILRDRDKPSRLVIWSTAPNADAEKKWQEQTTKLLQRDPQDVPAVRLKPLPRKPARELATRDGAEPHTPRFAPDGRSVLFVRFEPDPDGILHPDLFRWTLADGRVTRLTRGADVREVDPCPDGKSAVAVRHRHGLSQLVRVNLERGTVSAVTDPSIDVVYAQPRVSPDGQKLVFLRHEGGDWKLVTRSVDGGNEHEIPTPAGATLAYPAWSRDGARLFISVGTAGFVNIEEVGVENGTTRAITRTAGAALAPAPTPDGAGVYFLTLEADGLSLRYLTVGATGPGDAPALGAALAPAVRPVTPPPQPTFAAAALTPGRPYGLGRQETSVLVGGVVAPSGHGWELGARIGDVVGRVDLLALGSIATRGGQHGGAIAATWRGWPLEVAARLFDARERPSEQTKQIAPTAGVLDVERRGIELTTEWNHFWRARELNVRGGVLVGRLAPTKGAELEQRLAFVDGAFTIRPSRGEWRFPHVFEARADAGHTGGGSWQRYGGAFSIGVENRDTALRVSIQRRTVRGDPSRWDLVQLGGTRGSVVAESALAGRVEVPALPVGRVGSEHEAQRLDLNVGGLPFFAERHRLWTRGGPRGEWLRLAGIMWDLASEPMPLLKLPGLHATMGVARVFDAPLKDTTQWWLVLAWRS